MAVNTPNLVRNINLHIPEAQQIPSSINKKKSTNRYIIRKMPKPKDKEKILTAI